MTRRLPLLPPSFYKEILNLLKKSHKPRVKVAPSPVAVGDGVFVTEDIIIDHHHHTSSSKSSSSSSMHQHQPPQPPILCLYPGIYTPGLPLHATFIAAEESNDDVVYLANELVPPSGIPNEENAYIFNLSQLGGYLDGMALIPNPPPPPRDNDDDNDVVVPPPLDQNPSACGHKINHSSTAFNAKIVPFYWKDVVLHTATTTKEIIGRQQQQQQQQQQNEENDDNYVLFFDLPNAMRNDNSPWYFDGRGGGGARGHDDDDDDDGGGGGGSTNQIFYLTENDTKNQPLCGAAVVACQDILLSSSSSSSSSTFSFVENENGIGPEVFLNYNLKSPLPLWARDWYY